MAGCRQCEGRRSEVIALSFNYRTFPGKMSKLGLILAAIVLAGIVATVAFLATWDMPAPTARVEKVIPNDKLPR